MQIGRKREEQRPSRKRETTDTLHEAGPRQEVILMCGMTLTVMLRTRDKKTCLTCQNQVKRYRKSLFNIFKFSFKDHSKPICIRIVKFSIHILEDFVLKTLLISSYSIKFNKYIYLYLYYFLQIFLGH